MGGGKDMPRFAFYLLTAKKKHWNCFLNFVK